MALALVGFSGYMWASGTPTVDAWQLGVGDGSGLCALDNPQTRIKERFPADPAAAVEVCMKESSGLENQMHLSSREQSYGPFQINTLMHPLPAFLNTEEGGPLKLILGQSLQKVCARVPECVGWMSNPGNNAIYAAWLSNQGQDFSEWATDPGR